MDSHEYYLAKSEEDPTQFGKVGWSSDAVQRAGFEALHKLFRGDDTRPTVLDVGAGTGSFQDWLAKAGSPVNYQGVEPMESFVKDAEILGRRVTLGYGQDLSKHSCDYAVAHGTFNVGEDVPTAAIIREMWKAANKGVGFTMLSKSVGPDFNAYNPEDVENFCKSLSPAPSSVEVAPIWDGQFVVRLRK